MLFMKNNPDKAREMGLNGRKAVEENFSWNIEEKKLFAFYDKIFESWLKIGDCYQNYTVVVTIQQFVKVAVVFRTIKRPLWNNAYT